MPGNANFEFPTDIFRLCFDSIIEKTKPDIRCVYEFFKKKRPKMFQEKQDRHSLASLLGSLRLSLSLNTTTGELSPCKRNI